VAALVCFPVVSVPHQNIPYFYDGMFQKTDASQHALSHSHSRQQTVYQVCCSWTFFKLYLTDFLLNTKIDFLKNCPTTIGKLQGSHVPNLVQIHRKLAVYWKQINGQKGKY